MEYRDALHEIRGSGIDEAEFQKELETAVEDSVPPNELIWAWQKGESAMIQDMEDEIENIKRETNVSEVEVYERAFTNCVISRFLGPAKQGNSAVSKPEQEIFRRLVLDHYGVIRSDGSFKTAYCHLVHWDDPRDVRVAQLVPRQLAGIAISLLFVVEEIDLTNPRNGILLHKKVQLALDAGKIAIIPAGSDAERKWKVVLVDQSIQEEVVRLYNDGDNFDREWVSVRWKVSPLIHFCISLTKQEMDGRERKFLTRNQPARRFLFFRFVLTYIQAKIAGNTTFTSMVETSDDLWAYPGQYLDLSIRAVLARNIAGIKLPPPSPSTHSTTFGPMNLVHISLLNCDR
ncbi:hypothetical protein ASPWEDRAFT_41047 [Aspergillus wentii DTO 134E9]|uniref:HNH nuclease domain-containing protein n=1 Tax=Aspergillus wentii DTO 134E9 TaxID=1073089 RepID=A0A1L9RLJ5_ASPWE|nr:uncharacterized protein ASPWEDRAFT_41047 [Aspergillus wentii DTO 134E9]OJJ35806.1 hypothetical protein ASPWEDRAFT_41047 [Aspergillus wentii DTO 134E9]